MSSAVPGYQAHMIPAGIHVATGLLPQSAEVDSDTLKPYTCICDNVCPVYIYMYIFLLELQMVQLIDCSMNDSCRCSPGHGLGAHSHGPSGQAYGLCQVGGSGCGVTTYGAGQDTASNHCSQWAVSLCLVASLPAKIAYPDCSKPKP